MWFFVYWMIGRFGEGNGMIKRLELVGLIFTITNIIDFLLIEGFYIPCLIGIWFMYSYYQKKSN